MASKALEDARVARTDFVDRFGALTFGWTHRYVEAMDALIVEHERLTAPPTDDEREALNRALTGIVEGGIDQRDAIDAILAAGFSRQGPITDEEE